MRRLRSYLEHHRGERNGTIILIALFIVVFITRALLQEYAHDDIEPSEMKAFFISEDDSNGDAELTLAPFDFEPNTLSDSGYLAMGFAERNLKTLRKYQDAGGKFKVKSDFNRLYFISDSVYDILEPFILLPDSLPQEQDTTKYKSRHRDKVKWSDTARTDVYQYNPIVCDLNYADTTELKKLPGIGSFYANKIVEYRNALGGYSNLAQLLELWNMKTETIDRIADRVSIDQKAIHKLKINSATAQELASHPYISFHLASQIVLEREANGPFDTMENKCLNGLLNEQLCLKLAPYLSPD